MELDYPILSDPAKQTARAYGVLKTVNNPGSAPLEYAARNTIYIGVDGKIAYIDREVKPGSAGDDVAAHLTDLKVPQKGGTAGK